VILSIVTINRNNKTGLEKTLRSIYPKNAIDFEHIIIDGNSQDGSVRLIEEYAAKYPIHWVTESDSGIFNAMNKGLNLVQGDYVIFMNSGDAFCDNVLTKFLLETIVKFDITYGDIRISKGTTLSSMKQTDKLDFVYMLGKTICHQSVFMRSELCKKYLFTESYEFSLMGDWIQLFEILKNEKVLINKIDRNICIYDGEGQSEKHADTRHFQRRKYLESHYSPWELDSLHPLNRLRNRKYFSMIMKSLDSYKYSYLLNIINRWIRL
jgi:glycosyltransferase involved in cell wall biosynthesis